MPRKTRLKPQAGARKPKPYAKKQNAEEKQAARERKGNLGAVLDEASSGSQSGLPVDSQVWASLCSTPNDRKILGLGYAGCGKGRRATKVLLFYQNGRDSTSEYKSSAISSTPQRYHRAPGKAPQLDPL
jgi:hypothetical protein